MDKTNILSKLNRIKFLFDLNGYAIIRNVLNKDELKLAN